MFISASRVCVCVRVHKIKFAIQNDWQLSSWRGMDVSHSLEMLTLHHFSSWENPSVGFFLFEKKM